MDSELDAPAESCVANIGPRGISRRRRTGYAAFLLTAATGVAIALAGGRPAYQLLLLPGWLLAALGWFQASEKT